ncbi:hypothetical protein ACVMGF_008567 [Bradyrhizobium diazoefficiens]
MIEPHQLDHDGDGDEGGNARCERTPAGAHTTAEKEGDQGDDHGGDGEIDPDRLARSLELIAQPGQRKDQPVDRRADKHDEVANDPQQWGDGRRLAEIEQGLPCPDDAVVEQLQEAGRPAQAKAGDAAAAQQEECDHRKGEEEQAGVQPFRRQARNEQRHQQDRRQDEREVDPPALGLGIEAVDQLRQLGLDVGPAGADRKSGILGQAGRAILAGPDRIDHQEPDRGNDGEPEQQGAHDREQNVGRRVEQARAHQADEARGLHRRGTLGEQVLANEAGRGDVGHAPRLRLTRQP